MSFFHIYEDVGSEGREQGSDVVVLDVSGEIDYGASPNLRERIHDEIDAGKRHLVLDLSAVTFIDSMALGVLVGAVTRLHQTGGSLKVVCAEENDRVLRIFDVAGVANLIALHRSCDEALSALAASRPGEMRGRVERAAAIATRSQPHSGAYPSGLPAAQRYAQGNAAPRDGQSAANGGLHSRRVDELA